jgi:hypothetical protein
MNQQIACFKQIFVIVKIKQIDTFSAACELNNLGVLVDTVLSRTNVVMGWCTESIVEKIQALDFVDNIDTEKV